MKESKELTPKIIGDNLEIEKVLEVAPPHFSSRYAGYREPYQGDGFLLLDYWRAVRKRLWLIAGIMIVVTTLVAIYMARKPNIYLAKARIQVDLEQINPELITSDRQRLISNPDPSYFNTQLQLLSSDALLRRVIKEYSLDTNKALSLETSHSGILSTISRALGLSGDNAKNLDYAAKVTENNEQSPLSSDEIADAVRLAPYVDMIRLELAVEPVRESRVTFKDTRLIELSYRHTDPQFAAFLVNAVAEIFVRQNWEKRSGVNRKTNDFLQQRISDLQAEIRNDELKLVELKKTAGILKTDGEQTIVLDRLSGLNKSLLEAENDRKLAQAKYLAVLNSPENAQAMMEEKMARYITEQENSLREFRNDVQKKIADLKATRAKLLVDFKESAPEVKEIDTQIKTLEDSLTREVQKNRDELEEFRKRSTQLLLDSLKTEYEQAKDREERIRKAYDEQYNLAQGQNVGAVQIKLLEQNIETNKGFLDNLRKQQSGNDIAAQGSDNNISITDYAVPDPTPVSPRRGLTVFASLILSMFFGIGLALLLEYLDDTVRSTEEVETYLQLPALAAIPTIDVGAKRRLLLVGATSGEAAEERSRWELLTDADPRSPLAEAYRQLRTSILLSSAGHAPKTLLITSSLPSEGKTTTASNTAISLAQTGAKVLIIDADMRKPRVHSVFRVKNVSGLSNLLSSELSAQNVKDFLIYDEATRVSILPSGPIPPNPAELIGSEQMRKLIALYCELYDHVVIDSPPITSFTDGVLIASMVDGVILVVHSGRSSRQVVRRARQLLQDVGAKIFGVILNKVNLNSKENYYYYQSYYSAKKYIED
ncbi:MAG TPA: polysaccharide biosynthesis tyrosine autokinase [Pyrinomonadaceae bacterium]|nr:polysaccharide biosynthesis tyrosine autokinase [Pyrinomonadaceae bacterium]